MVKKMKQGIIRWQRGVIVACFAIMIIIITGVTTYAATTPTIQIVSFISKSTNLTTSQVLEVKTSGFPKDAILKYKYTNTNLRMTYEKFRPFRSTETKSTDYYIKVFDKGTRNYDLRLDGTGKVDRGQSYISSSPLFAIPYWNRCDSGTFKIEVTAENYPEISVSKTVEGTSLGNGNWTNDGNSSIGTMFVGEKLNLRQLMMMGGMGTTREQTEVKGAHFRDLKMIKTFDGLVMEDNNVTGQSAFHDGNNHIYSFQSSQSGNATVSVNCKSYQNGYGPQDFVYYSAFGTGDEHYRFVDRYQTIKFDFYVFDKPTITSGLKKITVKDTKAGIRYTLGGESFYCSEDNQEIVFGNDFGEGFLKPGQKYNLELTKNVSGKTARIFMDVETLSTSRVDFDTNGVTTKNYISSQNVPYKENNLSKYPATASGYDFLGWNEKPDGSGKNYSQEVVDKETMTVYAQWKIKVYGAKVDAQLNKTVNPNLTIGLYQNDKLMYNLKYDTSSKAYINNNIPYNLVDNNYDIYLNGKNYGKQIEFTGEESNGTVISEIITQYMYTVDFYLRTDDTKALTNEKVQLYKDKKYYDMTYKETKGTTSTYSLSMTYNEKDITKDGPYYIYLNNSIVQKNGIAKEFSISNDTSLNNLTFDFYSVSFEVKKDNQYWGDEASITIKDQDGLKYNMTYNSTSHKYETQGILDLGQSYKVYISGIQSREDINQVLNISQKTGSIDYYTVEFKDAEKTYETVIVEKGQGANKPSTPIKSGNTFVYWCDSADGSGDRYFQNGSTLTAGITKKTTIYATWKKPSVALGTYIKCDSDGTQNGGGKYYRLGNLSIIGFPEGGTSAPIRTAVFKLTEDSDINSKITVIGTNSNVSVTGNGTKNLKVVFKKGVSMKDAEEFLRTKIIVQPDTIKKGRKHTLNVSVFGVTG